MLIKTKNNVIGISHDAAEALTNIDTLRVDGTYPLANENGGGVYPSGVTYPSDLVVSASGDTQALDGNTRNYGLDGWGDWA